MKFKLELILDEAVGELLEDRAFLDEWKALGKTDPKVTVIQEPAYVLSWLRHYQDIYSPILCLARDVEGRLTGLMPLARSRADGGLTHVGVHQAEYHGWIAKPEIDQDFPIEAMIELKRRFSPRTWEWRWMPPRADWNWIRSPRLAEAGIFAKWKSQRSPYWDLGNWERAEKIGKNRSTKNYRNRYTRAGDFRIERMCDPQAMKGLMETIVHQNDFRQEAAHGVSPFGMDPRKRAFYIERLSFPEDNHFTVLWTEGRMLAFHFGACDRESVIMGLSAYDPREGKYSPGTLFLLEMGKFLRDEGFKNVDLTPGSDSYKERFATGHHDLIMPTFFFSASLKHRDDFLRAAGACLRTPLRAVGLEPSRVKKGLERAAGALRKLFSTPPRKLWARFGRLLHEKKSYLYFRITSEDHENGESAPEDGPRIQAFEDLLLYSESKPSLSRRDLLREATQRFQKGETLYTFIIDDRLAHYGWMTPGGRTHRFFDVDMTFDSPKNSFILYDFFTDPDFRRRGLYRRNLKRMLDDAFESGAGSVFIGTTPRNAASRAAIEKAGFRLHRKYSQRRVLFWTHKKEEECPS